MRSGVAPSHQRQGLGRQLLAAAAPRGNARLREAWVLTSPTNAAAQRLYSTLGGRAADESSLLFEFSLSAPTPRPWATVPRNSHLQTIGHRRPPDLVCVSVSPMVAGDSCLEDQSIRRPHEPDHAAYQPLRPPVSGPLWSPRPSRILAPNAKHNRGCS